MDNHRTLKYDRYEKIKHEVCYLLEECPGVSYPLDIMNVAKMLDYVVIPYSKFDYLNLMRALAISDDAYSTVEKEPDTGMYRYVIYFNDRCPTPERIAWSLAHEIGHIYLGHHDEEPKEEHELEANFFAKYLMAPPPLIHKAECRNYFDVAVCFNLSMQAAHYAYKSYEKWLHYGPKDYQDFELKMIENYPVHSGFGFSESFVI